MTAKSKHKTIARPHARLRALSGFQGWTLGQAEALSGINPQDHKERIELWRPFVAQYPGGDAQPLIDAVMDHCARITLARIKAGELCLVPRSALYH